LRAVILSEALTITHKLTVKLRQDCVAHTVLPQLHKAFGRYDVQNSGKEKSIEGSQYVIGKFTVKMQLTEVTFYVHRPDQA
jgi:hypothetical protein